MNTITKFEAGSLCVRVNKAKDMLDVSRATIYRMVKSGDLELVKLGKDASRITVASINRCLAGRSANDS